MAPDASFESMSYNPFTVNDNFFNSESQILIFTVIFILLTQIFQLKRNS